MSNQKQNCGHCRYYYERDSQCRVNPPVIVDAIVSNIIKNTTRCMGYDEIATIASCWPAVLDCDPACRHFAEGGK